MSPNEPTVIGTGYLAENLSDVLQRAAAGETFVVATQQGGIARITPPKQND